MPEASLDRYIIHRQWHLGSDEKGMLILRRSAPRPYLPNQLGCCFVSLLPNEIMHEIFLLISMIHEDVRLLPQRMSQSLSLQLVCSRWRRLWQRVLFRRIYLGQNARKFTGFYPGKPLSASLKSCPDLALLVRFVSIGSLPSIGPANLTTEEIAAALETVPLCQRTRSAWVVFRKEDFVPITKVLRTLPLLKCLSLELEIDLEGRPAKLTEVMPFLRSLSLDRLRFDMAMVFIRSAHPPSSDEIDEAFPSSLDHTSTIRSLDIGVIYDRKLLSRLLLWPRQFDSLQLGSFKFYINSEGHTLFLLQSFLDLHATTLRKVEIRHLSIKLSRIPTITHFTYLEAVHLPHRPLTAEKPALAAAKLAASNLRLLTIGFTTALWLETRVEVRIFSAREANWLEEFVHELNKKSNLRRIHIDLDDRVLLLRL